LPSGKRTRFGALRDIPLRVIPVRRGMCVRTLQNLVKVLAGVLTALRRT
jgi:hypothetical protein